MKAVGSNVSDDLPEVGAGTVGRSRPLLGPVTRTDPDSGELRWTVRDAASPSAAVVGPSAGVLSLNGSPGPIVHPPDSACDESPARLNESVALPPSLARGGGPPGAITAGVPRVVWSVALIIPSEERPSNSCFGEQERDCALSSYPL